MPKQAEKFSCKFCDFISSKKSNYDNHLTTAKHKYRTFRTNLEWKKQEKTRQIMNVNYVTLNAVIKVNMIDTI